MYFEIVDFNFTHREFEYFEYVYSYPFLNYSMVPLYLLGVASCFGLKLVSWFEQSGQAGPHRTLVNRLMSLTLDQVSHVSFFSKLSKYSVFSKILSLLFLILLVCYLIMHGLCLVHFHWFFAEQERLLKCFAEVIFSFCH